MKTIVYICPPEPPYGKGRREALKKMFDVGEGDVAYLCVNTKYRPQMKTDPDLRKLVKDGFLRQIRLDWFVFRKTHKGPFKKAGHRKTFLVKV